MAGPARPTQICVLGQAGSPRDVLCQARCFYALMLGDPDAPSAFRHWWVFDIPKDRRHLARGRSSSANTESLPPRRQ
ncbi:hypothetical protein [Rhizobium leguminosarum]|uniref:hypothetical protein n=1 Tax=Rhizobium leguminosarum TaxID=384 RepID=UPI00396586AC